MPDFGRAGKKPFLYPVTAPAGRYGHIQYFHVASLDRAPLVLGRNAQSQKQFLATDHHAFIHDHRILFRRLYRLAGVVINIQAAFLHPILDRVPAWYLSQDASKGFIDDFQNLHYGPETAIHAGIKQGA